QGQYYYVDAEEPEADYKVLLPVKTPSNTEWYSYCKSYDMSDVCHVGIVARYHGRGVDKCDVQNEIDDCHKTLWCEEEPAKLERGHEHHDRGECEDCCTRS